MKGASEGILEILNPYGSTSSEGFKYRQYFYADCLLRIEPGETMYDEVRGNVVRMTKQDVDHHGQQDIPDINKGIGRIWCLHLGEVEEEDNRSKVRSYALVLGTSPRNPERFIRLGLSFAEYGEHDVLFANAITTAVTIE